MAVYSPNKGITTLIFIPCSHLVQRQKGFCHLLCSSAPWGLSCCDALCIVVLATWDGPISWHKPQHGDNYSSTLSRIRCALNWRAALWGGGLVKRDTDSFSLQDKYTEIHTCQHTHTQSKHIQYMTRSNGIIAHPIQVSISYALTLSWMTKSHWSWSVVWEGSYRKA